MTRGQPDEDEARFRPPPEPDLTLALETIMLHPPQPPPAAQVRPPRRGSRAGLVIAALLIALVGAAVVVVATHKSTPTAPALLGKDAVSIQVVRPAGVAITIDGKRVGKAPLVLHRPRTDKLLLIQAPGYPAKQVVGDHDQIIDLVHP